MTVNSEEHIRETMFEFAVENARLAFDEHQAALNKLNTYVQLKKLYKRLHTDTTFCYYQPCINLYNNRIVEWRAIEAEKRRESMEWQTMCVGLSV